MSERKQFVLVTGASSGIGRTVAAGLSSSYDVILSGRNLENLNETKKLCSDKADTLIFQKDLSDIHNLEKDLSGFLLEKNIEVSHFVHCAGYMKMIPFKMVTTETIHTIFSTNLFSAALIFKVLTNRKTNNHALKSAVFISSNISNFGSRAFSLYGASKAGLDGLMRNLAMEFAPTVRVNSILPGAINTGMTASIFSQPETVRKLEETYPLGLGKTDDILNLTEFLLSDKSQWITGQQFTIDGGRTVNLTT